MANIYSTEEIAIAYQEGIDAARSGDSRAPSMSKVICSMIKSKNGPIGSSIPILKAFSRGYQDRCDREAAAILTS